MSFLLPTNVVLTNSAKEKIGIDFWAAPHSAQVAVLFYAHKPVKKTRHGEVLSETHDFFAWGAHLRSNVPDEALWAVDGHQFAIQDGRWERHEQLVFDVLDGSFQVMPQ